MRAFRFRAWHKQEKKMYQVSSVLWFEGKNLARLIGYHYPWQELWVHDEIELMQYTELVDRHGKTICEGDILRWFFDGEQILYVEWEYNYFKLVEVRNKDANVMVADKRTLEIIGNIYEHPELVQ